MFVIIISDGNNTLNSRTVIVDWTNVAVADSTTVQVRWRWRLPNVRLLSLSTNCLISPLSLPVGQTGPNGVFEGSPAVGEREFSNFRYSIGLLLQQGSAVHLLPMILHSRQNSEQGSGCAVTWLTSKHWLHGPIYEFIGVKRIFAPSWLV